MKKSVVIIFSLLLAFGLSSCGDDNSSGSNKGNGGSSSIVIPPGSITPTKPDTGDNGNGNQDGGDGGNDNQGSGDGGNDNQGSGDGGDGNQGSGDTPVPGGKCTEDVCNGQQALHCNKYNIFELNKTCNDNMVCALRKNDDTAVFRANCYEPCSSDQSGQATTVCQSIEDLSWTAPAVCEESHDSKYILVPNNSDPNALNPCNDKCENGECSKMADDENEPCDEETYPTHCVGNALVYCSSNSTVAVYNCAKDEDTTTCSEINDSSTTISASCIDASQTCSEPNTRTYICDDSLLSYHNKYSLIAYKCVTDSSGNLVLMHDAFFSVPQCGQTCDESTGQCCDEETGLCTFEEVEDGEG